MFELATGVALTDGNAVAAHRVEVHAGRVFADLIASELDRAA